MRNEKEERQKAVSEQKRLESLKLEGELSVMNQLFIINDYYLFNLLERQKKSKIEACLKLSKELGYSDLTGYLQTFLSKNIVTDVENKFKSLNNFANNVRIKLT